MMSKLRKGWWRMVAAIPAVVVLALALSSCAVPQGTVSDPKKPRTAWVDTGDGRLVYCLDFGSYYGYTCDWNNTKPNPLWKNQSKKQ